MSWSELPRGDFSDIDWAPPGATDGFDPYLVWAEASKFAGYRLKAVPRWLPILIEVTSRTSIRQLETPESQKWLRIPGVYTSNTAPQGLRFCTAYIKRKFFDEIRPGGLLEGLVERFELGLPVEQDVDPPVTEKDALANDDSQRLTGKVIGMIDGGLAFANANLLRQGSSRTQFFWRQDAHGVGATPLALGYGHELTARDIDSAMASNSYDKVVDEAAVYKHFKLSDLEKRINHGTHVMDLAGGPRTLLAQVAGAPPHPAAPPSWALANDDASRSDLIAVQLDWSNIIDTSGGSMNVSIMDALMYILSRCALDAKVAVNISWGTLAGPHNGTSVLEAAMDQLIALKQDHLHIIVPAGNFYQGRTHANASLAKDQAMRLNWKMLPDDSTQSFLEIWLPKDAPGVTISVTPPGGFPMLSSLPMGLSRMYANEAGDPICALIFPKTVATGRDGTCALLAVAPTFSFDAKATTAPCGIWTVSITNTHDSLVTVDAYIERDDVAIGQHTGARQSHFEDALYDTSGNPGSFVDKPVPFDKQLDATLIRRSGTFNSLATGKKTVSVAGERIIGDRWARYSPQMPDPDSSRPQRPGVVKVPTTSAYSDENPALWGVRAAGTYSGSVVRLVGTSSSGPQVTRDIFNSLVPCKSPSES